METHVRILLTQLKAIRQSKRTKMPHRAMMLLLTEDGQKCIFVVNDDHGSEDGFEIRTRFLTKLSIATLFAKLRAFVRMRSIAWFWWGEVQAKLCRKGARGRKRDLDSFKRCAVDEMGE